MSYSFDEIMSYHPDNRDIYQEIRESLPRLIPFIGAGLTQFVYSTWTHALKTLSGKLTDSVNSQKINDLIDSWKYLEAAQLLEDLRTPANLAQDMAKFFSPDKLEQKRQQLPREPISLLPLLFPELVLTTNFDETLETVYRESGHPFQPVVLPGHPELLRQFLRRGGSPGLLKFHGTLSGHLVEYERIVFTLRQYNRHYGPRSPLKQELKACFEQRIMFFLGCSLENDRTMDLLQEILKSGDYHYTIINCKKSERDEKIRQLGKKHIRAILYEEGRHEAVRVILEHLLEETDPEAYKTLPFHIGALKTANPSNRFSPKAELIPFSGREQEMQELFAFRGDPNIAFRWWAITGPGGGGKSRLAYEFQKRLPPGWTARYLGPGDYANLSSLTEDLTQCTLLIADYVQENAKEVGRWMEQLATRERSLPLRVLLVERDAGNSLEDSTWIKQLYADVHYEQTLKSACYRDKFLELQPLSDADLLSIIGNSALAFRKENRHADGALSEATKHSLLQKLKSIDPGLCRPLYAMFLTDAYVAGEDPEKWNRNEILDYITTREQKRMDFNIRQILGNRDQKLFAACLHLKSMATVLQDVTAEKARQFCPDQWHILQSKADSFVSPEDLLDQAGFSEHGVIPALRPDLMGEYFVYTWLLKHSSEARQFLCTAWQEPASTAVFFDRMFHDYNYFLNESMEHWELLLPKDVPASEEAALLYAMLLVNATFYCNSIRECERQVALLEQIACKYSENLKIAIEFAGGLVNLSDKQEAPDALITISRLEFLSVSHPDVTDIAISFAKGLVNLSTEQEVQDALITISRLELLSVSHPDVTDIKIVFAMGLFNLSSKQEVQDALITISRLELLSVSHPDVTDIAIAFAMGLFSLSSKQEVQDALNTVSQLEFLSASHPDVTDIAIAFAKGLVNLSFEQDVQDALNTISRLELLSATHPDVTDIAIEFANGLFNLSVDQGVQDALYTIAQLEFLSVSHPEVTDIAIIFANCLVNLIHKQNAAAALCTVKRLNTLSTSYPDVTDIAVASANGLYNLSNKQNSTEALITISWLELLSVSHPNITDIAIAFAKGLFNLSIKQDEINASRTITRLQHLAAEYPDTSDLTALYDKGLELLKTRDSCSRRFSHNSQWRGLDMIWDPAQ